ncbi:MAG: cell division protein ZipA [SAR86 cluster bacterium]|uniref:Cell division protein ZipA n=1 Tax=SAR86 cluster bacterium TaxID=2030880 RepID=A0A2A5BAE8_9GAMM|nr:MAG: cell division protein ZipA [SAR86 cluster bacterium]
MGGRELVILLLGLAIVAVVLRGLYVAIQARRGQIRLAIDKNIPRNVDLDALEMSELPGGGARTIDRSLEQVNLQNSALNTAQAKAEALHLGDNEGATDHIPVLMDAVEVRDAPIAVTADVADEAEFQPSDNEEDYEDHTSAPEIGDVEQTSDDVFDEQDDSDNVLFDYDENDAQNEELPDDDEDSHSAIDTLDDVTPDYDDSDEDGTEFDADETSQQAYEEIEEEPDQQNIEDEGFAEEPLEEETIQDAEEEDQITEQEAIVEPANSSEDFAMTAGERIGFNAGTGDEIKQSGLFDELEEVQQESVKPKRKSIFSVFGRKVKNKRPTSEPESEVAIDELEEVIEELQPEEAEFQTPQHDDAALETEQEVVEASMSDVQEDVIAQASPIPEETEVEHSEPSEVIVINVMAKQGRVFAGNDLLHCLITAGLRFGDMNIFHKRLSNDSQGPILFSVANMLNPGTFDLNNMENFTTLGVSFFLALPTPINNMDAFEQLLEVAQQIRDTLDGELKDDHRNGMTVQTTEHYRQRIRDFELLCLKTAGARG